jgi:hypothetical protein
VTPLDYINPVLWVISNLELLVVFLLASAFVVLYILFWDVRATTGGEHVWTAFLALATLGLLNVVGLFIDGRSHWWQYPTPEPAWWRPALRFTIYTFVGWSFARLVLFLIRRKFRPEKLTTAPDEYTAPRPRHLRKEQP